MRLKDLAHERKIPAGATSTDVALSIAFEP